MDGEKFEGRGGRRLEEVDRKGWVGSVGGGEDREDGIEWRGESGGGGGIGVIVMGKDNKREGIGDLWGVMMGEV